MVKAYYYGNGEIVTLYDKFRGDSLSGTLFFPGTNVSLGPKSVFKLPPVLPKFQPISFNLTRVLASILLVVSLVGLSINVIPLIAGEINLRTKPKNTVVMPKNTPNPVVIPPTTPIAEPDEVIDEFKVSIPKLNLEAIAIVNVDPSNPYEYNRVLAREGIAHAKGSYLPGQTGGPVVLFAHSTDTVENILQFNAKFFGLKDMEIGDEIILTVKDKQSLRPDGLKVYHYKITSKKVVEPYDISSIQSTKDDLVLSTCWPPGTNWQRLLVFAKRV